VTRESCFPTGRKRRSDGNKCDSCGGGGGGATATDIYMTYDRNAKRIDNRQAPERDVQQRTHSLPGSSLTAHNTAPAVVRTTPSRRYDLIKRSCLHASVFIAALTAAFSRTDSIRFRPLVFRCSIFAMKPSTSAGACLLSWSRPALRSVHK